MYFAFCCRLTFCLSTTFIAYISCSFPWCLTKYTLPKEPAPIYYITFQKCRCILWRFWSQLRSRRDDGPCALVFGSSIRSLITGHLKDHILNPVLMMLIRSAVELHWVRAAPGDVLEVSSVPLLMLVLNKRLPPFLFWRCYYCLLSSVSLSNSSIWCGFRSGLYSAFENCF